MAASDNAQPARRAEPKRLIQLHLPIGMLAQVEALIGADVKDRSEALRKLIRIGLRATAQEGRNGAE